MRNERNWGAVRAFVAKQCGVPAATLKPETTLFGDLGLDGDDATEFFEAFREQFVVDLTGLDLRLHFGPEGWPIRYLVIMPLRMLWMARPGEPHRKAHVQPIRLSSLVHSVETGRWIKSDSLDLDGRPVV